MVAHRGMSADRVLNVDLHEGSTECIWDKY